MVENESLADDVDLEKVAAGCEGFSGSDLRQLCTAAAMRPVRDLLAASGKSASTVGLLADVCVYLSARTPARARVCVRGWVWMWV
jgi:SpoVK/Ycf46/Vps4 family AAA+-type ATPase